MARVVGGIAVLLIGACMIFEIPAVQKKIIDAVLSKLNPYLDGEISIGKIGIRPFNAVYIEDLLILDHGSPVQIDTFFYAHKIGATVSLSGLLVKEGVHIGKARVEDGVFHLVIEKPGVGFSNLNRIFGIVPPDNPPPRNENDVFDIRTVRVRNMRYQMTNLVTKDKHKGSSINWGDLDVVADEVDGWMKFSHSTMFYRLDHLAMHEKTGYIGTHLSGHGEVGHGRTIVRDFHLEDPWSIADFPEFRMTYGDCIRMRDFVNKVILETHIGESDLNLKTISFFTGIPFNDKVTLHIKEAYQKGPVNYLQLDHFKFTDYEDAISGNISGSIAHLTGGTSAMFATLRLEDMMFTTDGLQRALSKYGMNIDINKFAPGEMMKLNLRANGPFNHLRCKVDLSSESSGKLSAKAEVLDFENPKLKNRVHALVETDRLDLGHILASKALGPCTMKLGTKIEIEKGKTTIRLDSLRIKEAEALGYTYTGIAAAGSYDGNLLNAKVISSDPNLNFLMQGNFNTSQKTTNTLTKFYLNLGNADLAATNIDKRGNTSKISLIASGQFMNVAEKDMVGDINIEGLTLEDGTGVHHLGDISLYSTANGNTHRIQLNSSLADGSYAGDKGIAGMLGDVIRTTVGKSLPVLLSDKNRKDSSKEYGYADLDFTLKDTKAVCSYVMPGLYIANGTHLSVDLSKDGSFSSNMQSQRLAVKGNYIKDFSMNANNEGNTLNALIGGGEIKFNQITINGSKMTLCAQDNGADINLHYDTSNVANSTGDVSIGAAFARNPSGALDLDIKPRHSLVKFNDFYWTLEDSEIKLENGVLSIDGFKLYSNSQSIMANGRVSKNSADNLKLEVRNFDLNLADQTLLGNLGIDGLLNAELSIDSSAESKFNIIGNASVDSLIVDGNRVGSIFADGKWNNEKQQIEIDVNSDLDGERPLIAKGTLVPSSGAIDLRAYLDKFNISAARPFLSGIFSEMSGYLNGGFRLGGTMKELDLRSSDTRLEDARLKLAFTDVAYNLNGPFTIDNTGIRLKNVKITDDEDGTGTLNGGITYNRLKDLKLDASVKAKNLAALKVPENYDGLYGKVYTDLDVHVHGPFNDLTIDGTAGTAKNGNIHIPLGTQVAATSNDILTFTDDVDSELDEYKRQISDISKKIKKSGINLRLHVKADRNTELNVDINKSTGNYATVRGNGVIGVDIRSNAGSLILAGDYEITEGKYHFAIPGIVNKDFIVNTGSSIKLNGDLKNTDINLSATYKVKTSLSTLLADTSAVSNRRPVECIISITDKLTQPKIGFDVQVKDLDPTTKARVDAALNTEDKIQKQFVALLVAGMFLPDEQSSMNTSGGNIIYSNVSQVVSNQLNMIMQRLNIPVDLGLGYQQNNGMDLFDVAISTQLFNNRVVVNGSVGNKKLGNSSSPSGDVVGDIDIEVKIDKPGNLRLKMFSHSADQYTSFLDYSQRNGVGISYQKEYSNFFELIGNIFSSKAKREEKEKIKAEKNKDMKTISIE